MKKYLLIAAAAGSLAMAGGAHAATVIFNFNSPAGLLGTTQAYTVLGRTVTASGFTALGAPTALFGKSFGGDENGLGLHNDPSGENEVAFGSGFIQLDVTKLTGAAPGSFKIANGSTTGGEAFAVIGTNIAGSILGGTVVASGTTESTFSLGGASYKYYDFLDTSVGGNVLLKSLTATVPEPSTWAMMMVGVGMAGYALRRRQAATLA